MKASRFAETVALIGFVAGGLIASSTRGMAFYVGVALSLGSVVWYFTRGQHLQGWVGRPLAELQAERDRIDEILRRPGGSGLAPSEEEKLYRRLRDLSRLIREHPDSTLGN